MTTKTIDGTPVYFRDNTKSIVVFGKTVTDVFRGLTKALESIGHEIEFDGSNIYYSKSSSCWIGKIFYGGAGD